MINGFGLHRIGTLALRFPVFATVILAVLTLTAAFGVTRLGFSGDNIEMLRDGSQEMADYDHLLKTFRNFNNDAIVLVRMENLATVDGMETYRDVHFEFQLDERVDSVLSLFALVQYDESQGGWGSAVPAEFTSDAEVAAFLKQLVEDIPNSQSLMSPDFKSAVMVVYTKPEAISDDRIRETLAGLVEVGKQFESEGVSVSIAGQPAIRADLIQNILQDLLLLAPIAMLFCGLIALVLFRHPVPVILCALPSIISVTWFLGAAGLAGVDLDFLTNILPVLLIVIVFADTLHLYLKWQKLCQEELEPVPAMHEAIRQIGPACAISSVTTAAALLSLCASRNLGLMELGIVGAISVFSSFLCMLTVLPIGCYWASRAGFVPRQKAINVLAAVSKPAIIALNKPVVLLATGLVVCLVGLYGHWTIDSRFRLLDYLGSETDVAKSENYIDKRYVGTTPLFVIVKLDPDKPLLSPQNEKMAYEILDIVAEVFSSSSFYSLNDFAEEIRKGGGTIRESDIDQLPRYLTNRFISEDKRELLITIFSSASLSASQIQERLDAMESMVAEKGYSDAITITGYPVLAGVVAPRLMDNLRISLLLAVILSVLIITIAAGSIRTGLACLVPNLLPILGVELVLLALGIPLNMSITVALTVAFGIAVDDSIHLLNQHRLELANGTSDPNAVREALKEVTPAIFSTTLILSGGLVIMMFSTLPAISVFSAVVILTLLFAFLTDIFQLPAYLLTLRCGELREGQRGR